MMKAMVLLSLIMAEQMFVYISALEQAGLSTLSKGDDVIYDLETINGRTAAVNIAVLYY